MVIWVETFSNLILPINIIQDLSFHFFHQLLLFFYLLYIRALSVFHI